jgi:hypothetical protein
MKDDIITHVTIRKEDYNKISEEAEEWKYYTQYIEDIESLVQSNQEFFGKTPAGSSGLQVAFNKLYDLVEFYNAKKMKEQG